MRSLTLLLALILTAWWATSAPTARAGWIDSAPEIFEARIAVLEAGNGDTLAEVPLAELTEALDQPGPAAARAAVLLAWILKLDPDRRDAATEVLVARLEQRQEAPSRALDAGDVAAAAALGGGSLGAPLAERLARLADGPAEHPDLEVRVECAGVVLAAGRREVLPFLFRVLRSGTPDESLDPPDWPRKTTLTWAKSRAAEILSRAAGRPCTFRADGSFDHQARETESLVEDLR